MELENPGLELKLGPLCGFLSLGLISSALRIRNFCSIIDVLVILSISLEDVAALRHEGLLLSPLRPSPSHTASSAAVFRRKTWKIPSVSQNQSR